MPGESNLSRISTWMPHSMCQSHGFVGSKRFVSGQSNHSYSAICIHVVGIHSVLICHMLKHLTGLGCPSWRCASAWRRPFVDAFGSDASFTAGLRRASRWQVARRVSLLHGVYGTSATSKGRGVGRVWVEQRRWTSAGRGCFGHQKGGRSRV